jgi:hypothetical protein
VEGTPLPSTRRTCVLWRVAKICHESRINPRRESCPAGRHPDPRGIAGRVRLADKVPLRGESCAGGQLALVTNIQNGSVRHSDRLPRSIRNSGYSRTDWKSAWNRRQRFSDFYYRKRPANFHRRRARIGWLTTAGGRRLARLVVQEGPKKESANYHPDYPPSTATRAPLRWRRFRGLNNWRPRRRRLKRLCCGRRQIALTFEPRDSLLDLFFGLGDPSRPSIYRRGGNLQFTPNLGRQFRLKRFVEAFETPVSALGDLRRPCPIVLGARIHLRQDNTGVKFTQTFHFVDISNQYNLEMPRQSKRPKIARRKTGKISVTVRMSPETRVLLDKAAEQFGLDSFSAYVEKAVLEQVKRDKITNQTT